jgi:DNA integrity scanning protein DisA with diadenylate cyclase activity/mannitol/fructose-specific phosphotransferase system IIA component (Ntr-type)
MSFGDNFVQARLVNLKGTTLEAALDELLATFPPSCALNRQAILHQLMLREKSISTYLGNGIAIPHLQIPLGRPCLLAVGRCPNGLQMDGQPEYANARLLFLVLFDEENGNYLQFLASLTRTFHNPERVALLTKPQSLKNFHAALHGIIGPQPTIPDAVLPIKRDTRGAQAFLQEAYRMARGSGCTSVFLFADALVHWFAFGTNFPGMKRFLVTERPPEEIHVNCHVDQLLNVSNYSHHRLVQAHSAILLALSRNLLRLEERVCCVGGLRGSDQFDCLLTVNVAKEYRSLLHARRGLIPKGVRPEVFERLIAIAHEIAHNGREGRAVGSMFVIGSHERIKDHYRALVLNPFYGYPRQERNILNPFMDETIKEFTSLDGAFIIDGDGVLEAAGAMIHAPADKGVALQGGLGTRHASAAAFSKAHDCLIAVISQGTGQVTLFRNGQMLSLEGKILG